MPYTPPHYTNLTTTITLGPTYRDYLGEREWEWSVVYHACVVVALHDVWVRFEQSVVYQDALL